VIDTTRLGNREWLADRMRDFSEIIHGTPRSDERTAIRLPGEIELDTLARQRRDGIDLDDKVLAELERMAGAA